MLLFHLSMKISFDNSVLHSFVMRGRAMSPSDLNTRARQLPLPTYSHMAVCLFPRPVVYLESAAT